MTQTADARPPMACIHHFSATVTDVEASAAWYQQVLGLQRIPPGFPHYGNEENGYAVVLAEPTAAVMIGLHRHAANGGSRATSGAPVSITSPSLSRLVLTLTPGRRGSTSSAFRTGVNDTADPVKYSVPVFRDPDNIQLEPFFAET